MSIRWSHRFIDNMAGHTLGPLAKAASSQLATSWPKRKRSKMFQSGRPIISFVDSPFRPMLNILARLIFHLIPVLCPDYFASEDVYTLLTVLKIAPADGDLILINQDLAGFFSSIDQARFIGAWHMLLDFLSPHMNVGDSARSFRSIRENPTTREISSRVAHFIDSMSPGRSESKMSHPLLKLHLTCKRSHSETVASVNAEAVRWAVPCPRLYV